MHKQLGGIGTEAATSCPCVPGPGGQRQRWGSIPGCRELEMSPARRGQSLCGDTRRVHLRALQVSALCLAGQGAGAAPAVLSAVPGQAPVVSQPCSGSCRGSQHGLMDKSLRAARGTSASAVATGAQGQCSPAVSTVCSAIPASHRGCCSALNPPGPVGMGARCALGRKEMRLPALGKDHCQVWPLPIWQDTQEGPSTPSAFFLSS